MPVISATTLFVAGSMRWMLSPAALVWTMRTEPAAPRVGGAVSRTTRAREVVFIYCATLYTKSTLTRCAPRAISVRPRHDSSSAAADLVVPAVFSGAGGFTRRAVARFRLLQVARRADLPEQTERPRTLLCVPLAGHAVPAPDVVARHRVVERRRVAEEFRRGPAARQRGQPDGHASAAHAARRRGRRHRVPPRRKALAVEGRSGIPGDGAVGARRTMTRAAWILAASAAASSGFAQPQPAHTLVRNAIVLDGSGAAGRRVDVRIEGDRIAEVGRLSPTSADRIVDAHGLTLAPGFVDTHSHASRGLFDNRDALAAVSQGITTVVVGQDGSSPYPLASFFYRLRTAPAAGNVASYL